MFGFRIACFFAIGLNATSLGFELRSRKGAMRIIGRLFGEWRTRRGRSPYAFFQQ